MKTFTERQIRLFWEKVNKTDACWLWTASVGWNGYGMFGRPTRRAHLVAIALAGVEVPEGYLGCHKCNTPRCVRYHPDHVYIGTASQNMQDRKASGFKPTIPHVPGELNGASKLTEEKVREILKRYNDGKTRRAQKLTGLKVSLAKEFGVSFTQIKRIVYGQAWRHL